MAHRGMAPGHRHDVWKHADEASSQEAPSGQEWEASCSTAPAQGQRHGWTTLQGATRPLMQGLAAEHALVLWFCVHAGAPAWQWCSCWQPLCMPAFQLPTCPC